ncbi:MAG TPA: hypothetical protein VIO58_12900 [Candidatus Methanoperedens sp.]
MKQQTAFKILAAFMIFTMVFSVFAYMFRGPLDETEKNQESSPQQEKYNPELWNLHPDMPFYSISDALNMTPVGAEKASYLDLEGMPPQMMQWAKGFRVDIVNAPLIDFTDYIYKSNTTKVYYAGLKNESFLILSTMYPEKNDFEYIVYPNTGILVRQEQGLEGMYNIMGTPVIFAPPQTAIDVFNIITSLNKTPTAYDRYEGLLGKVDPAPFQVVNSNVSFAKQFYMGVKQTNGSYERTAAYLDVNSSTLKKLNQLKANSTENGLAEFNITRSGNYTLVKVVSPDLSKVLPGPEETS